MNTRRLALLLVSGSALAWSTSALSQTTASSDVSEVVVTGARGQARTVLSSPSPIDVVGAEQLQKASAGEPLRDGIARLVPSFQVQMVGSASWNSVTRPAGLRGLSGAHVLVLVDGKRRHNSSLIDLNPGNQSNGANPVDLDLIPSSAIQRIEVLRDGAAAQYGSDAIGGVINVILKATDKGAGGSIYGSQRFKYHGYTDGQGLRGDGYFSFAMPGGGSTTLAIEARNQSPSTRSIPSIGAFYFPLAGGVPDPREATVNKTTYKGGLPQVRGVTVSSNTRIPLGEVAVYSSTTVAIRRAEVGQAGRRPNSNQNIAELYPNGFTPFYTLEERDWQTVAGLKGEAAGWDWDLSSTFGENNARNGAKNTLNASLGPSSPTSFDTFKSRFSQWTTNLDITRGFKVMGDIPLQVSLGLEHRHESYATHALDETSYRNGGYRYPSGPLAGQPAAVGAQGNITLLPSDEASLARSNEAAYVDLSLDPSERFSIGLAGRYERFNDSSGDVLSGKLSTRYEITPAFAIRATVSNGFRAPSLPQQGFARTATQFSNIAGVITAIEAKTVTVNSAVGRALGAAPLTPEKSINYSVGLTYHPMPAFIATIDAYRIELDDRVVQTSQLSGGGVRPILIANGLNPSFFISYFTNAIDTRTDGVDLVGSYHHDLAELGAVDLTVAANWNETRITHVKPNPSQLAGINQVLFGRQVQGYITDLIPNTKVILSADWKREKWSVSLRGTRYGSFDFELDNRAQDEHYRAKWLADLDVTYELNDHIRLGAGAQNIFDVYPSALKAVNSIGQPPYSNFSPFGNNGGFYYVKVTAQY